MGAWQRLLPGASVVTAYEWTFVLIAATFAMLLGLIAYDVIRLARRREDDDE